MKTCVRCGVTRDPSEFRPGHRQCRPCLRELDRERSRKASPEQRARRRAARERHRAKPNHVPRVNDARFQSFVGEPDESGCWPWRGTLGPEGYGKYSATTAHRVAWERVHGPIPAGLTIDHLCRTRHCVNPAHMEVVTRRENTLRGTGFAATNALKTHCVNGHEYTPETTDRNSRGHRSCRTCRMERQRRAEVRHAR